MLCHTHHFAPLRVDVHEGLKLKSDGSGIDDVAEVQVWGTFRGNEWGNKGEVVPVKEVEGKVGVWGFEDPARGVKEYYIERAGCEFVLFRRCFDGMELLLIQSSLAFVNS